MCWLSRTTRWPSRRAIAIGYCGAVYLPATRAQAMARAAGPGSTVKRGGVSSNSHRRRPPNLLVLAQYVCATYRMKSKQRPWVIAIGASGPEGLDDIRTLLGA